MLSEVRRIWPTTYQFRGDGAVTIPADVAVLLEWFAKDELEFEVNITKKSLTIRKKANGEAS